MSFSFGNFALGSPTSPGRFQGGMTRGRINGSNVQGVNYPSPFFDIAHTYLPTTVKQLFKFCRYYFLTNPIINACITKLSEYPITDVVVDHEDPEVVRMWSEYFNETIRIRSHQIESGLDYFCYGTSAVSLSFPFQKYLTCTSCGFSEQARKIREYWLYTSNEFRLSCPKCGQTGAATPKDWYYRDASSVRPVRWNVEDVEVSYNDISGDTTYFYTIPAPMRADITLGKKDIVEGMPQIFLQAIRQEKGVVFSKANLFVMKRATLAFQDRGWGIPLILPVLKDAFYLQIMKKASESLMIEHIVPLRILFPQAASGSTDPFSSINLLDWRDQVAMEIARWRQDNAYVPIVPLPIGNQTIGGDGKALLLGQEMQQLGESIINGLGVPIEFIKGGASWSGTNVSMRMVENSFLSYIGRRRQELKWIMSLVSHFMGWPKVNVRLKPFKMADDMQRKSYLFQLNAGNKVSDTTLLADADLDMEEENDIMVRESARRLAAVKKQQLAMAEIQGESQVIMMKMQAQAQQTMAQAQQQPAAPGEPDGPEGAMNAAQAQQQGQQPPLPPMLPAPPEGGGSSSIPQSAASSLSQGQDLGAEAGGEKLPVDLIQLAEGYAAQISDLQPDMQEMALNAIAAQNQDLADLVAEDLAKIQKGSAGQALMLGGAQGGSDTGNVDQRPLPGMLPPRRMQALV